MTTSWRPLGRRASNVAVKNARLVRKRRVDPGVDAGVVMHAAGRTAGTTLKSHTVAETSVSSIAPSCSDRDAPAVGRKAKSCHR